MVPPSRIRLLFPIIVLPSPTSAPSVALGLTFTRQTLPRCLIWLLRVGKWQADSLSLKVQFEVWLPQKWNNRFAMVGNGGDAGGVNYPSMGAAMKTCMCFSQAGAFVLAADDVKVDQFAVSSTDTGHNGTTGDGTFAIKGVETQIDFGHRAVTLTAQYSKAIIKVRSFMIRIGVPVWRDDTNTSRSSGILRPTGSAQLLDWLLVGRKAGPEGAPNQPKHLRRSLGWRRCPVVDSP